jgi:hypothetical protein
MNRLRELIRFYEVVAWLETDGIVTVAVECLPQYDPNNGALSAVAKCQVGGICQWALPLLHLDLDREGVQPKNTLAGLILALFRFGEPHRCRVRTPGRATDDPTVWMTGGKAGLNIAIALFALRLSARLASCQGHGRPPSNRSTQPLFQN